MKDLRNRVAVITGAASGIGRGLAEAFVDAGMRVVLSDVERVPLESTTNGLRAKGADVHAIVADVSKAQDVSSLAESTLEKYGAVHVLCNNAGVAVVCRPSWTGTLEDWTWILGVNLMGVVHGIRTFLPIMIQQGEDAHIVNTSSMGGLITGGSLYGASKSAVVSLSETVYLELVSGGFRPRVSVLCPGLVDSDIFHSERNRPDELSNTAWHPTEAALAAAREAFKRGLSPRVVAEHTIQAIRDERFYVLTHPEWTKHVEHRAKQIVNGENPTTLAPPGV
jgi:NAD(P)-dependent dehydrogenase (short-subunit alcohol dehydrogenase family)